MTDFLDPWDLIAPVDPPLIWRGDALLGDRNPHVYACRGRIDNCLLGCHADAENDD